MPELPEVETIVRGLQKKLTGGRIRAVRIRTLKIVRTSSTLFRRSLTGAIIRDVLRKGKFILIELESDRTLVIHLRMTGQLLLVPENAPLDPHTHVVFDLEPGEVQLRYRDVRKFGRLEIQKPDRPLPQLTALSPDPFEISARELFLKLREKKSGTKTAAFGPDLPERPGEHLRRRKPPPLPDPSADAVKPGHRSAGPGAAPGNPPGSPSGDRSQRDHGQRLSGTGRPCRRVPAFSKGL